MKNHVRPLEIESDYRSLLGCSICKICWLTPVVKTTLEELFAMNEVVFCPSCGACGQHLDPELQCAPVVLKIYDLNNEFAIIEQF